MTRALVTTVFLCSLFAGQVHAEPQYWVSVGSFQDKGDADDAQRKASEQVGEPFFVVGVETGNGYYYRVALGPFLTRELAEDRIRIAREQGYPSAWMWTQEGDPASSEYSAGARYDADGYSADPDTELYDYDSEYDPQSYLEDDEPASDAELREQREEIPELVEEPPPGYKLNKLRRDASLVPQARPPPDEYSLQRSGE